MPQNLTNFDPALKDKQGRKRMPISKYFKGHGEEVMAGMKKKYGERAENVFYATANKKGMKPESNVKKAMKATMRKKGKK